MIRFRLYNQAGDPSSIETRLETVSVIRGFNTSEGEPRYEIQLDLLAPLEFKEGIYTATMENLSLEDLEQIHERIGVLLKCAPTKAPAEKATKIS